MELERIGILDPDGINLNPLTGKQYSKTYKDLAKSPYNDYEGWARLPMYNNPDHSPVDMINDIIENRVVILEAGTGNGKSVLMPKYALHAVNYTGKVVITNPKQVVTKENADYAASCLDVDLGREVGYQYQGSKLSNGRPSKSSDTLLLFSTDGTVERVLENNPSGTDYDIVIIDEAHERNIRIDKILLLMKRALRINQNIKLIVMSATLPGNLFTEYYKEFNPKVISLPAIPNYPVEDIFLTKEANVNQPDIYAKTIVNNILKKNKTGDIICFVKTKNKANSICNEIVSLSKKSGIKEKLFCIGLDSKSSDEDKKLAIDIDLYKSQPGGPYDRKIVIGTEVIESSITIKGAVFVLDNGESLSSRYYPEQDMESLMTEKISKASAIQRKGRVGRTKPGECYKLYTKKQYKNFDDDPTLEIKKIRTEGLILSSFKQDLDQNLGDVLDYLDELIEPPPDDFIEAGIKTLRSLKIISDNGENSELTPFGQKTTLVLDSVGNDIKYAAMLVASYDYDVVNEITALISILTQRNVEICCGFSGLSIPLEKIYNNNKNFRGKMTKNFNLLTRTEKAKLENKLVKLIEKKYKDDRGDIFTMLRMYKEFYVNVKKMTKNLLSDFCEKNYLNYNVMKKIRQDDVKIWRSTRFLENYKNTKVDLNLSRYSRLLISILYGFNVNIAKRRNKNPNKGYTYQNWFPMIKTKKIEKEIKSEYLFYTELFKSDTDTEFRFTNKISENLFNYLKEKLGFNMDFPEEDFSLLIKPLVPLLNLEDSKEIRRKLKLKRIKAKKKIKTIATKPAKKKPVKKSVKKKPVKKSVKKKPVKKSVKKKPVKKS